MLGFKKQVANCVVAARHEIADAIHRHINERPQPTTRRGRSAAMRCRPAPSPRASMRTTSPSTRRLRAVVSDLHRPWRSRRQKVSRNVLAFAILDTRRTAAAVLWCSIGCCWLEDQMDDGTHGLFEVDTSLVLEEPASAAPLRRPRDTNLNDVFSQVCSAAGTMRRK